MASSGSAVGRPSRIEFDLDRPPTPLRRGRGELVGLLAAWLGVYIVVIILVLAIFQSSGNGAILLVLPLPTIVGWGFLMLLGRTNLGDNPGHAPYRTVDGALIGYGGENPRPPDREEKSAWRALRRHRIGRIQYERVRARRHLAHGEIDRHEYEIIVEQLSELDPVRSERVR
jgi:hypothetical protein